MSLFVPFSEIAPAPTAAALHDQWYAYLLASPYEVAPRSWAESGIVFNHARATAELWANLYSWITETRKGYSGLLKQMFLLTAEGDALDLHAAPLVRLPAVAARHRITLTREDGDTSTIQLPQTFIVSCTSPTDSSQSLRFFAEDGSSDYLWTSGATHDFYVVAEFEGAAYNAAQHTITTILTPVTGVASCTNNDETPVRAGRDAEDGEILRDRALSSMDQGFIPTAVRYRSLALATPNTGVTDALVRIPSYRAPNAVDILVATATGTASTDEVDAVQAYVDANVGGTENVQVMAVASKPVTVTLTLYTPYRSGTADSVALKALINAALAALFDRSGASQAIGITPFVIEQDVTADEIKEAIYVKVPKARRQRIAISSIAAPGLSYDAGTGVLSVGSATTTRDGANHVITISEASAF